MMVTRVTTVLLFAAACFLLYYGGTMLLFVPAYPGEGYFVIGRLLHGVLPFVAGLASLWGGCGLVAGPHLASGDPLVGLILGQPGCWCFSGSP